MRISERYLQHVATEGSRYSEFYGNVHDLMNSFTMKRCIICLPLRLTVVHSHLVVSSTGFHPSDLRSMLVTLKCISQQIETYKLQQAILQSGNTWGNSQWIAFHQYSFDFVKIRHVFFVIAFNQMRQKYPYFCFIYWLIVIHLVIDLPSETTFQVQSQNEAASFLLLSPRASSLFASLIHIQPHTKRMKQMKKGISTKVQLQMRQILMRSLSTPQHRTNIEQRTLSRFCFFSQGKAQNLLGLIPVERLLTQQ